MFKKVGIIGLGLIGGSLAKALKNRYGTEEIVAFNRHQDVLDMALSEGVITKAATKIDESFQNLDIIFLCTPVDKIFSYAQTLLPYLHKNCILTDVGSTKGHLYEQMRHLETSVCYIGGHPMTGAEKFRYQASKEHLFENAYYILTPSETAPQDKVAAFQDMVTAIGAIPVVVSPAQHDHIVASISHAPQIVASGLVNMVKNLDASDGHMHLLAAGGFKDTTRIASSSPDMWESICLENREEILSVLQTFSEELSQFIRILQKKDSKNLYTYFEQARQYRDSFSSVTPGRYVKRFEINVDIKDRPGSLAVITVLLSSHNINIKNISIVNNRERDNGALLIAFSTEEERKKSILLLKEINYEVYQK